jgi:hypothetical protein
MREPLTDLPGGGTMSPTPKGATEAAQPFLRAASLGANFLAVAGHGSYPLTTPKGRSLATFLANPAFSTTSTTRLTSL